MLLSLIAASDNYDDILTFSSGNALAKEFHWSDATLGAVPFAETLAYALFAFFIASLADCYPRHRIITFGLLGWSVLTGFSGLAVGFASFIATRFLLGGADACFDTPSASLLTDCYPSRAWPRVLGAINAADLAGILLGLLFQGLLIEAFGWRSVYFTTAGLSLVIFVLAVAFLREPGRGTDEALPGRSVLDFREAWKASWSGMSANFRIVFGNPVQLISIVGRISLFAEFLGLGYFFPLLLFRYFGVQVAAAAPLYGVVVVTSIGGSLLGGWLNGSLEQRYGSARHCLLAGLCLCAMGASYFVGLLIGTLASVVVASWVMGLFMGAAYPALGALVGEIQPSERRTFGFAAQIAPAFFIGGFAPLVIGAMSDAFGSLWAASALFTALISLIGVVVLFSSRLVNPTPS